MLYVEALRRQIVENKIYSSACSEFNAFVVQKLHYERLQSLSAASLLVSSFPKWTYMQLLIIVKSSY
jgi:hypothetical protein